MSDESTTEVLSIGKEGVVGLSAIVGAGSTNTRSMVQISGTAIKLPANIIRKECERDQKLQQLLLLYSQAQLNHVSQVAACRSNHDIEQRLARWLLLINENTQQDILPLTQKFIALMLGVRRASITETAISFQKQGIIQYSRGQIKIVDRFKLKSVSCECHERIIFEYKRLLESKLLE